MSLIARLDLFINFVVVFVEQRFAMYLLEVLLDLQLKENKKKQFDQSSSMTLGVIDRFE